MASVNGAVALGSLGQWRLLLTYPVADPTPTVTNSLSHNPIVHRCGAFGDIGAAAPSQFQLQPISIPPAFPTSLAPRTLAMASTSAACVMSSVAAVGTHLSGHATPAYNVLFSCRRASSLCGVAVAVATRRTWSVGTGHHACPPRSLSSYLSQWHQIIYVRIREYIYTVVHRS